MADSASFHAEQVLGAIFPSRKDLLERALFKLTPDHFVNSQHRTIFIMASRYYEVTQSVLRKNAMQDILRGWGKADPGKVALLEEIYDSLLLSEVGESSFDWSLEQLRELYAEKQTEEALVEARTILKVGLETDKGSNLRGQADARDFLISKLSEIENTFSNADTPEGDMREEADDMLKDYEQRKLLRLSGKATGVYCGLETIDSATGGFQNGELVLIVGYSGGGKTSLCCQLAWHAAVNQGKNVIYLTSETLRTQVRHKLLARHSKLPQFELPEGLNSFDLRQGSLNDVEERKLREIIDDFSTNGEYGKSYITQIPYGFTISQIGAKLRSMQNRFPVDLVIVDYLNLLKSERKRASWREEADDIIKSAKQLATTFNSGQGVPLISPWQVSREAKNKADSVGYYTSTALADTSESTKSSDIIISVLEPPSESRGRYVNVTGQILKNRSNLMLSGLNLKADFGTCTFTEVSNNAPSEDLTSLLGNINNLLA